MSQSVPSPAFLILTRIWAVHHGLESMSKRMRSRLGVTAPQRAVLRMVQEADGITAGQLARQLHDHPSTLTGVLRRLELAGYLERRQDTQDRRKSHFHLTETGFVVCGAREGSVEEALSEALADATPEEIDIVSNRLDRIAAVLKGQVSKAAPTG